MLKLNVLKLNVLELVFESIDIFLVWNQLWIPPFPIAGLLPKQSLHRLLFFWHASQLPFAIPWHKLHIRLWCLCNQNITWPSVGSIFILGLPGQLLCHALQHLRHRRISLSNFLSLGVAIRHYRCHFSTESRCHKEWKRGGHVCNWRITRKRGRKLLRKPLLNQ